LSQKKLVKYFIFISIVIIVILPLVNMSMLYKNGLLNENSFRKEKLFNTDNVEGIRNYFCSEICKFSFNTKNVIIGKNDYLFLGNNYARVIDKCRGTFFYQMDEINTWTEKLKKIQQWYERKGIKFVIVIAPNKHTVYKEYLPEWINTDVKTITDDIVMDAASKKINLLDLRPILKEKSDQILYMKSDTHWNHLGASIGYIETFQFIDQLYHTNYALPVFELKYRARKSGDLAKFLKIRELLPVDYEIGYEYVFEKPSYVCHGNISRFNWILDICKVKENLVLGSNPQYIINKDPLNKDNLLFLADSFSVANSKLYNKTFNTIWKAHYQNLHGHELREFVLKHKPDIVIYQVVERKLYCSQIVDLIE